MRTMMQRLLRLALWLLKQAVYFAMWLRRSLRFSSPRKKRRCGTPPWWLRLSIYLAMWPKPEFYEYRVSLQRKYLKSLLKESPRRGNAFRYALGSLLLLRSRFAYRSSDWHFGSGCRFRRKQGMNQKREAGWREFSRQPLTLNHSLACLKASTDKRAGPSVSTLQPFLT